MKTFNLLGLTLFIQISTLTAASDIAATVILKSNSSQTQTYQVPEGKTATIRSVRLASQGGVLTINGTLIASSAETGPQELALPMIISSGNVIAVAKIIGWSVQRERGNRARNRNLSQKDEESQKITNGGQGAGNEEQMVEGKGSDGTERKGGRPPADYTPSDFAGCAGESS